MRAAEIHAVAARHWMTAGPDHLETAPVHTRAAGELVPLDEVVELADRGGRMSLSLHDYAAAARLLSVALELDTGDDRRATGQRLCDLAAAHDGLGEVVTARELLDHAATLGELAGDAALVARAAVAYALPVDWHDGNTRSAALLTRAEVLGLAEDSEVIIRAARALVEMRIPVGGTDEHQVAWVTRPGVAHSLSDEALAQSVGRSPEVRGFATLAWRTTHRAPRDLARRRELSTESLDFAQILRQPTNQVEAAVWLAVDALESADRPRYDEALSIARWVAERDGNPRLAWRAHTLSAGAAHLDVDLEAAGRWQARARQIGQAIGHPGWLAADMFLIGESALSSGDLDEIRAIARAYPEDFAGFANPVGRVLGAHVHALAGNEAAAERMVRRSLRQLDPEASYLLLATRSAAVVELLDAPDLARHLIEVLEPWAGHVAVDSHAWWCDGPVDLWLAVLWQDLGDHERARRAMDTARPVTRAMNDVRSIEKLNLMTQAAPAGFVSVDGMAPAATLADGLSERQRDVLALMASGATNAEIARALAYSMSTIRMETMAIYRRLEVKGRTEAIATAAALGLLDATMD